MIGDRWKDVEAGRRAGCGTILMHCDYVEPAPEGSSAPDFIVSSLAEAVRWMQRPQQRTGKRQ
jgi:D-glycero-D-manno-heptose 1,7-bisphosphate phosphatase